MDSKQVHRVDEVMFSFTYFKRQQASQCNSKLSQLMSNSILPELEKSFDQFNHGGIMLELDRLEIDLGTLSEDDISEGLGEKIRLVLVQALKNEIRDRILREMGNSDSKSPQSQDFFTMALKTFFLKGYFPSWVDSNLNLSVLLNNMISNFPKALGDLIKEVSHQSESARKRIAYLDAPYFDQIIGILIPGDAEWVLSYRNTYLEIHQSESDLPGSSENLEKALNHFILTFITRNTGTKFNRLSFSDRFLKSIAAHYNLDFREFLQEITEILRQNTIESQLFRDFREALAWVGEKNQLEEPSQEIHYEPNPREFIAWLEQPGQNKNIADWLEELTVSGSLGRELLLRFPGFWNSLSKAGLTRLIKLLGRESGDKWLEVTYLYLAESARLSKNKSGDQIRVVREIFDLAAENSSGYGLPLSDLEGWFAAVAFHAFKNWGVLAGITQSLLTMGHNAGISHPTLILIKVKNKVQKRDMDRINKDGALVRLNSDQSRAQRQKNTGFFTSEVIHESVLFEYLNSGTLEASFRDMSKPDLQGILAEMVKSLDPFLLDLFRNKDYRISPFLKARILDLVEKLNRKEAFSYISRFADPQTIEILSLNEKLISAFNPGPGFVQRLDREVWALFIDRIRTENQGKRNFAGTFPLRLSELYFSIFSGIKNPEAGKKLVMGLQKRLDLEKSFMVYFGLNRSDNPLFLSLLENAVAAAGYFFLGNGLLDLHRGKAKEHLQKQKSDWNSNPFYSGLDRIQVGQLRTEGLVSFFSLPIASNIAGQELADATLLILKKDFNLIKKSSLSKRNEWFHSVQLKSSVHRLFIFFQANPKPIRLFFKKNKNHIPLILFCLYQNLPDRDWEIFSVWADREFSEELKIFNLMMGQGLGSVLDSLLSIKGKSGNLNIPSGGLDKYFSGFAIQGMKGGMADSFAKRFFSKWISAEMEFLFGIPASAFYKTSVSELWRRAVLLSTFQSSLNIESGRSNSQKRFWVFFLEHLKEKRMVFGPENLNWYYLLNSGQLEAESKATLLRFFKNNYLKSSKGIQDIRNPEGVASAIQHLNQEGFLPWWSPVKSKSGLVFSLVTRIEYSKKEDAHLLILLITKGKKSGILSGISLDNLKKLRSFLAASLYKRHYSALIRAIEFKIEKIEKSSVASQQVGRGKGSDRGIFPEGFKDLSSGKRDQWIKKQVNASREKEVLRVWFSGNSKIQMQLEELLSWSRFMFFGNLNPGKWRIWVLGFGFDYYLKKGNAYSDSFLGQFLGFLTRSRGMVNWKAVFHQLFKNREFPGNQNPALKNQILAQFPSLQERKSEELSTGDQVKISNAGLILCWPFLSVLFSRLKLSSAGVLPVESQPKAIFLLQYLVFGYYDFPEYELVLNKILVGMESSSHLEKTELTGEEKDMADSLLQGMKNNWDKMKNASHQAIRETFLQRDGILEFGSASNILRIQKTGVDVLLDSVSWNISVVRLPWMEKSLEVKWR